MTIDEAHTNRKHCYFKKRIFAGIITIHKADTNNKMILLKL